MSAATTTVKEHPILFSGPMVKAILAGKKTQTRRLLRLPRRNDPRFMDMSWVKSIYEDGGGNWVAWSYDAPDLPAFTKRAYPKGEGFPCPYGLPGGRLWVREAWGAVWPNLEPVPLRDCKIEYRADLPEGCDDQPGQWPADDAHANPEAPHWRPSIFMPRWASRLTLEVVAVRAERLQDISRDDALAEGMPEGSPNDAWHGHPQMAFCFAWDRINGKRADWNSNPFVWVVEFKRVTP